MCFCEGGDLATQAELVGKRAFGMVEEDVEGILKPSIQPENPSSRVGNL